MKLMGPHPIAELTFTDCRIPKENLIGEPGRGMSIALSNLDFWRMSVGAAAIGVAQRAYEEAISYAKKRIVFGQPLSEFQVTQFKLADMATEIDAARLLVYRAAWIKDEMGGGTTREASMAKVYATEVAWRVVDQAVQLHGGYGFIEEYAVCGAYRDARITRLFEGTSEINRMLVPGTIMRRALKGQLDMMTPVMQLMAEIKADAIPKDPGDGPLGRELTAVDVLRRWAMFGLGVPAQEAMVDKSFLTTNQMLLEQLADLVMDLYAAESALLRTQKMIAARGEEQSRIAMNLTQVIVYEKLRHGMEIVRQICANTAGNDSEEFLRNRKAMNRLVFDYPLDTMRLKAEIADWMLEREHYRLG